LKEYDVVFINGGFGNLITYNYLLKKMRKVIILESKRSRKLLTYKLNIHDPYKGDYDFNFFNKVVGNPSDDSLFSYYLNNAGINFDIQYKDNLTTAVIDSQNKILKRPNDLNGFQNYLIRLYPAERENIIIFFTELKELYSDYRSKKIYNLENENSTVPDVYLKWSDKSLLQILNEYFNSSKIMQEFRLINYSSGHHLEKINAYNYIISFFDVFFEGAKFASVTYTDLAEKFTDHSKGRGDFSNNQSIKKVYWENNKIDYIETVKGEKYKAKFYVVNERPDHFIQKYNKANYLDYSQYFKTMYPDSDDEIGTKQLLIGLNINPSNLGMDQVQYLVNDINNPIIAITNYNLLDGFSAPNPDSGSVCVDFRSDGKTDEVDELLFIVSYLDSLFPGLSRHRNITRFMNHKPLLSSQSTQEFYSNMTLKNIDHFYSSQHISPYENVLFMGEWLKPESGIAGQIYTGVEYGDMIDELIIYGQDEEYLIDLDELMVMLKSEFIVDHFGETETTIQIAISKSLYYLKIKHDIVNLYEGNYSEPDLFISLTNESLFNLINGEQSLDEVLNEKTLEFSGDKKKLYEFARAFNLGTHNNTVSAYHHRKGTYGLFNVLFTLTIMSLFIFSFDLINQYFDNNFASEASKLSFWSATGITSILFGGNIFYKYKSLKYFSALDYFIITILVSMLIIYMFLSQFAYIFLDASFLAFAFGIFLLISWIIKKPILLGYLKFDYSLEYTSTNLFHLISSGLTFIWSMFFLAVSINHYLLGSYANLMYYLIFLVFYLMYNYKRFYIRSNINS
jgi:hypothetical protein